MHHIQQQAETIHHVCNALYYGLARSNNLACKTYVPSYIKGQQLSVDARLLENLGTHSHCRQCTCMPLYLKKLSVINLRKHADNSPSAHVLYTLFLRLSHFRSPRDRSASMENEEVDKVRSTRTSLWQACVCKWRRMLSHLRACTTIYSTTRHLELRHPIISIHPAYIRHTRAMGPLLKAILLLTL